MAFFKTIFGRSSKSVAVQPDDLLISIVSQKFRFITVDVETANSFNGSICQVGVAGVSQNNDIMQYSCFVDPREAFDAFNVQLHGIDAKKVKGAWTFVDCLKALQPAFDTHCLIQHSNFDKGAFSAAAGKARIELPAWEWRDSVQIARRAWPELKGHGGHGLANLKKHLSLSFEHHDAGEDARAAALVVLKAEEQMGMSFREILAPQPKARTQYQPPVAVDGNPAGPLAGQIVVFTGALSLSRNEAANIAAEAGMTVATGVTKKTTLLVVGDQDLSVLAGHEKSSKHRKAEELQAAGQGIRIISEGDFLRLVSVK